MVLSDIELATIQFQTVWQGVSRARSSLYMEWPVAQGDGERRA
jgi:hypothetical protein